MSETRTEPYFSAGETPAGAAHDEGERATSRRRRRRNRLIGALVVLFVLLAIAAVVSVVWQPQPAPPPERAPAAQAPAAAPAAAQPEPPRYPVAPTQAQQPPLDMSDATLLAGLATVFGDGALSAYLERSNVVRRIVATVDNVPRRTAPPAQWPLKPAAGSPATRTEDGRIVLAEANGLRYAPYVRILESMDTARFVELYRRHYPLFEQAYRDLGYPAGGFNDRAVQAIDVLLATPALPGPLRLTQPKVFLQYADPDVERLPAGQKLMLRIGPENAKRVRAKLLELRAAITDPALAAVPR